MIRNTLKYACMALLLAGSAVVLFACEKEVGDDPARNETLMTEYSENLSLLMSQNGRRSYHFTTPLLEGYQLAREPYREFRKGVKIVTYLDDSLSSIDAVLTANYAIYYENRRLWEAKGNVVVKKSDGRTLYTEQLFWNQITHRIYSNVDTRMVQKDGADDFMSAGFESDEDFSFYNFREMDGKTEVDLPEPSDGDSTVSTSSAPATPAEHKPERKPAKGTRPAREQSSVRRPAATPEAPAALRKRTEMNELQLAPADPSVQPLRIRESAGASQPAVRDAAPTAKPELRKEEEHSER